MRAIEVHGNEQGLEAAAREARYAAIVEECSDAAAVLLAHTKNDQAETVLIGLLRSAGLDAIAGMEGSFSRDGVTFLRPWLDVTREETTGICEDLGLEWWDDPGRRFAAERPIAGELSVTLTRTARSDAVSATFRRGRCRFAAFNRRGTCADRQGLSQQAGAGDRRTGGDVQRRPGAVQRRRTAIAA